MRPAPPFTFAPAGRAAARDTRRASTPAARSQAPGLRPLTASQTSLWQVTTRSTPAGETPRDVAFDAPYVSDLRFLALPGHRRDLADDTTPTDTTTTTPAAPVGPPPEIEDVHTTALTAVLGDDRVADERAGVVAASPTGSTRR